MQNFAVCCRSLEGWRRNIANVLTNMGLTGFFFLAFYFPAAAKIAPQLVTLSGTNLTVHQVFAAVKKQTNYAIFYNKDLLKGTRRVTIDVKNMPLNDFLSMALKDQPFEYYIENQNIIITRKSQRADLSQHEPLPPAPLIDISGKVTDADGNGLAGASVRLKGSDKGVSTDQLGNFTIQAPNTKVILVVSYIGYQAQEVQASADKTFTIVLRPDESSMSDVVVVGYGKQKRKDITGAVSSVSQKDLGDIPMSRIDQALEGLVPGLDVVPSGSNPGDDVQMRLRGNRSFTASNNPLIILDGIPFYGSMNDINPYDVASIDVLKDASSTAIYGSQGANGVIIITTRRGLTGPPKFSFESYAGIQPIYGLLPYGNGAQYAERGREAFRQAGGYTDPNTNDDLDKQFFDPIEYENIKSGKSYNYPEQLLQTGHQQKYQLMVTGGSKAVRYNVAASYLNKEGNLPGRVFDHYTLRTNLDFTISPKVTAGTSVLLSYNLIQARTDDGALSWAYNSSPLGKPFNDDGTPRFNPTGDGFFPNPMADFLWNSFRWDNKRWAAYINAFAEVKILPKLVYRIQLSNNLNLYTQNGSLGTHTVNNGIATPTANLNTSISNQKLYESILTYDNTFNSNHQLTLTAVQSFQNSKQQSNGIAVTGIPYELSRYYNVGSASTINSVNSNLVETTLRSYVGRLFYGYKSKYLMTLSIRADGASQFSSDHKWGYFPSAALAWRISEEKFLDRAGFLSDLKLRLSYGITGNQGISPYQTQGGLSSTIYSWDESGAFGYRPSALANKNLKWETTEVYNIGLDYGFFNGRITGNVEVYNTNTYNLLMLRKLPITSGFEQVLENIGSTNNKGFELGINTVNIDNRDFKWSTGLSFFLNREKIVELYNGKVNDIGNAWFIGQPIQVFYDFKKIGIWQTKDEQAAASVDRHPGQIRVMDINGDGSINDLDRSVIGSRQPDYVASISNRFRYKNFDFSFTTYVRWGGEMYVNAFVPASGKRSNALVVDYWTPRNPTNDYPRPDDNIQTALNASTLGYRDGSFIRLKYLSVGYTLPKIIFGKNLQSFVSKARIYLSGENLWYWTKSDIGKYNMDPEWSGNVASYPAFRTLVAGVNINF